MNVLPPISTIFVHTVPHRRRVELMTTTRLSLLRLRLPKSLSSSASPAVYISPNNHHFRRLRTLAGLGPVSILSKLMEGTADTGLANGGGGSSAAARVSSPSNGGGGEDSVVQFPLSPSSALKIQKGDITRWFVDGSSDAIVNPANERMLGGGGADGAIHRAAGPELRAACYNVPEVRPEVRCPTGEARITLGFRLSASHVIHTVGPVYDVDVNPEASLRNAYRNSLRLAKHNNIQYIAFPAISCGVYRYPFEEAAAVAISSVKEFANDFKEVHFVLFFDDIYNIWLNKVNELLQDQSDITTAQQLAVFSEEAECTGWNEM